MLKKHTLHDLKGLYRDAETADQAAFAEMRSNVLLVSGNHYARRNGQFIDRIRASRDIPEQSKIRLVMNHTGKIVETYVNYIQAAASSVGYKPKTDKELQDIKAAELHNAVWNDAKVRYRMDEVLDDSLENFVTLAEEWAVLKWNHGAGNTKSYEQYISSEGQPISTPVMEGAFEIETPFAFDMLADPKAKDLKKARFFIQRKVGFVDDLKAQWPEVADKIKDGRDETFRVFDSIRGDYRDANDKEVTVKEFYFKKCELYPNGYFYITTDDVILAEGELPFGIFPVTFQLYKKVPTYRRGISIVKRLRPYQVELNRAWSKMSEHQITLGDDKVMLLNGTQVTEGMQRPGIDFVNVTGSEPVVIPGRNGSQYLEAALATIEQMYKVSDIDTNEDSPNMQDPFALLYRAGSRKQKFKSAIRRHERFLKDLCMLYSTMAKNYLPDDMIIQAVSRSEAINIPEFKNTSDINTQVVVEEQSEDLETKYGRQLQVQQILQYVGKDLKPEQLGALLKSTQTGIPESVTMDLTSKYDIATNVILALDRGQNLETSSNVDHDYMIMRLDQRMTQSDFQMLRPEIQMMYQERRQFHVDMKSNQIIEMQRMEQGIIPTGGGLVSMDFYVPDPNSPGKLMRAKAPQEAIAWFFKQLDSQRWVLDPMQGMSQGSQADIAQKAFPVQQSAPQATASPWQANMGAGGLPMAGNG